ncbi:uncharacterized protein TNCT_173581 [Trichonephila clavata]|uniref:Uncharacterized protein n=1 Tax=Trichonephila clavata TaxID=2740835 RepID=A0A8X6LT68_TRICU|nr:uncharacterized protein TNCT_173581 [Trichonephila clavata]
MWESDHQLAHWLTHVLSETFLPTMLMYGMVGHYSQGFPLIHCDIPSHFSLGNGYFDVNVLLNAGYFISHDSYQLTDFTALAELLPAITEPSVVLHIHYTSRTSPQLIYVCDPFTYLQEEKNSCLDLCPITRMSRV